LANWRRDLQAGAEYLGASVIPPATLNFAKELMVMRDYKTSVLVTTPPLARHLLTVMARMNLSAAELSLKKALLVASPLPGAVRREIEAGFQVRSPRPTASPRSWGRGWPTAAAPTGGSIFPKTISIRRSSTLKPGPAPPGAPGELVITTLSTVAFPLVRFRSGDRTSLITEPCPCGRTLARLGEITGRGPHLLRGRHQGPPGPGGALIREAILGDTRPNSVTGWSRKRAWKSSTSN
jgi:phenylacetate-CoA ligase